MHKLLDGDAGLSDKRAQGSLGDLSVIRNGEPTVRGARLPQDDVAALLAIHLVSELAKHGNGLAPRYAR
jgi:hypothetical protein